MSYETITKPLTVEELGKELQNEGLVEGHVTCTEYATFYELLVEREGEAYAVGLSHDTFASLKEKGARAIKDVLLQKLQAVGF
ncbi:hypothetical protein [Bacillus sp. CGMCC 1.16541]|uniref:hypothetical protein n=1 Tax=Bacillus sp. CGMCC 1.16541 TaxID=2185143 RepID=UPI000D739259|nr:hypothetical protein [Bacillus sp. CGMCC 1.16541]